jgi:uncharacterized protein (TIGR00290 family)
LRGEPDIEVAALLATVSRDSGRVAMHRIRRELLERQAAVAGVELWTAEIPDPCPDDEYDRVMGGVVERARAAGIAAIAFGDLYLEDVRDYRVERLAGTGVEPIFPLWGRDTRELAGQMLDAGLRARIASVDTRLVDASLAGRDWNRRLLAELPASADPCGENGEFHTFAVWAPGFAAPVHVENGERSFGDGFAAVDLLPA